MILYDFELDENCYKVRLLLAMADLAYEKITVDMYPGREERQPAMLALNPVGTLPILVDADVTLHGAEAILLYLANRYATAWWPADPASFGEMTTWLYFSIAELAATVELRRHALFGTATDLLTAPARRAFRIMEDRMILRGFDGFTWFAGAQPNLADLALFPAIALSRDFGVEHEAYPALRRWMRHVRKLPGFITMPGIPDYY